MGGVWEAGPAGQAAATRRSRVALPWAAMMRRLQQGRSLCKGALGSEPPRLPSTAQCFTRPNPSPRAAVPHAPPQLTFDGRFLTTTDGTNIRFWDVGSLSEIKNIKVRAHAAHGGEAAPAARRMLCCRTRCGCLGMQQPMRAASAGAWASSSAASPNPSLQSVASQVTYPVEAASYCPAKRCFASGGSDMWVRLHSFDDGSELECNRGHHGPVHTIRFGPEGKEYASVRGRDGMGGAGG